MGFPNLSNYVYSMCFYNRQETIYNMLLLREGFIIWNIQGYFSYLKIFVTVWML